MSTWNNIGNGYAYQRTNAGIILKNAEHDEVFLQGEEEQEFFEDVLDIQVENLDAHKTLNRYFL